jgi:glucokinase
MLEEISIGLDIGGTNIELAWIKKDATILRKLNFKTNIFNTAKIFVEQIGDIILTENKNFSEYKILGLGIGAPNGNFYTGTIENAANLTWKGVIPLQKMFAEKLNITVKLTNDANAAAYAEMIYGDAQKMKNFAVITLGTGLGSGIVVNGEMLYGATGFAGEFGHTIAVNKGRLCGCGKKGCLETYASATGIVKTISDMLLHSTETSSLRGFNKISSKTIFFAAQNNDTIALQALEFTGEILGKSLADFIALFSPEAIFITGGLAKAHTFLIPAIEKSMNNNLLEIFKGTVKILPSKLIHKNAGLLGAAALVLN